MNNHVKVFGKAGMASLNSRADAAASMTDSSTPLSNEQSKTHRLYPTVGVGMSYDITQHLSAEVSWNRMQPMTNPNPVPGSDLISIGFTYHFN